MTSRRNFFKTAALGGAAFAAGLELGGGRPRLESAPVVLHGFLPADEASVQRLLAIFLAGQSGALPAPTVDVPVRWRATVAASLRAAAPRFRRAGDQIFEVQATALEQSLPADILLQQEARVVDPARAFDRSLLALREDLRGRDATLAVTCRLAPRPRATAEGRVLVIENERGLVDRVPVAGPERQLELAGPAGATSIRVGGGGVQVTRASCRHETCRRQGSIALPGEMIACAPNRLVLRVETA